MVYCPLCVSGCCRHHGGRKRPRQDLASEEFVPHEGAAARSVASVNAPNLRALLFQGRNLSDFLRDFRKFCLIKKWDKKAMWYMFLLFVCESLSEEVYAFRQKAETWDELENSLRLRFPEDGMEGQRGECFVPPVVDTPPQAELSGLQGQVRALEERLTRLEEVRKGKRKVLEDSPSEPADQGERGVEKDDQESPLSIGTPKKRVGVRARGKDEGFMEIKEERDANMVLPVRAPDPKRGLVIVETSSAAGQEGQKRGWWSERWVEKIASHYKWSEERMLKEVIRFIHIGLKDEVDKLVKGARSSWGKFCDDMGHKYWLGEEHPTNNGLEMVPRPLVAQAQPGSPLRLPSQQVPQGGRAYEEGQKQAAGRGRRNGGRGSEGRSSGKGSAGGKKSGWGDDICRHCAKEGHIMKFCRERRADEASGLIRTNIEGGVFDRAGERIDPTIPGGTRKEALRRDGALSTAS
ncbi:hypothetical protein CBR_g53557 [Chara braunii]|uniref:CCHC-type domain-containing protein n=1 Tax=Chara braunii TaxID=69332 RepID=A0A388MB69_CHABU|nr:hypothetical protein CBR_g53557 [Chara braunii]|eukprot:GBG91743.1 hypothetical protein CBR_g53557 [Chara braunii]